MHGGAAYRGAAGQNVADITLDMYVLAERF